MKNLIKMNFENNNLNDNYKNLLNILKNNNNYNNDYNNNDNNNINYYINYIFISLFEPLKKKIIKLKNENKNLKTKIEKLDNKCTICLENSCNIIFIPCGHLCMCYECSSKYDKYNFSLCPICRSIGKRNVVYK